MPNNPLKSLEVEALWANCIPNHWFKAKWTGKRWLRFNELFGGWDPVEAPEIWRELIGTSKHCGAPTMFTFGAWISTGIIAPLVRLPPDETPVLILFYDGKVRIGEIRWEQPAWDDTFQAFQYWDDPEDDGKDWDWADIIGWMHLPEVSAEILQASKHTRSC